MSETSKVDQYILKKSEWSKELELLRETIRSTGVEECLKWGAPVYAVNNKNVVGLAAFKNYVAIWFYHGALLKDAGNKLLNAQEGKTVAMRQWRFSNFEEIEKEIENIEGYVKEAIQNMKSGKVVKPATKKPLEIPALLQNELMKDKELKQNFEQLNLTRQREYCEHIESAKRETTKQSRLEKIIPLIVDGKGLHDKYR